MRRLRRDLVATASLGVIALALATMAAPVPGEEIRPGLYRTPDARFGNLPDFDFEPRAKRGFRSA